jgi:hypothetical protein
MMKRIQHCVKHRTGSLYTEQHVVFSCTCAEERNVITICTELCYTCENSYIFRLYKCRLHQAGSIQVPTRSLMKAKFA